MYNNRLFLKEKNILIDNNFIKDVLHYYKIKLLLQHQQLIEKLKVFLNNICEY